MAKTQGFTLYQPDDDIRYYLIFDYIRQHKSVHILGAEIYNNKKIYLGYWDAYNMPLDYLRTWRRDIWRNNGVMTFKG